MRRSALVLAALAVAGAAPHADALTAKAAVPAVKAPVIALVDTGVRPTHQEFDYRGKTSTVDQFVGWWDFTAEKKGKEVAPRVGEAWDTAVSDPYDGNGHGTITASMAAGRNVDPSKTKSVSPGAKLAIARVGETDGTISGDIAAAVTWADTTIHADVISISIGSIVPLPADVSRRNFDAIAAARSHGVLVTVSNGNGYANAGVPGDPGWASNHGASTSALSVGAAGVNGYQVSTDPEVAAVFTVTGPGQESDKGYVTESGTSFGTPYVAGFAAALLTASRESGRPLTVDRLEQLLKYSATDTSVAPTFEGYGVLSGAELGAALGHARAGTLPTRPSPDVSGLYVENVAGTLRFVWETA